MTKNLEVTCTLLHNMLAFKSLRGRGPWYREMNNYNEQR